MRVLASYTCILYEGFIFCTGCLGEKKTCDLHDFLCILHEPNVPLCYKRPRQSLYINLFHSLSPKWSSHFPQLSLSLSLSLSLFGAGSLEKNEYASQHTMRVSTCIIHVQLTESRPLVSNNIYSIGLVKAVSKSLQELVRASSSSMLVTLNNV